MKVRFIQWLFQYPPRYEIYIFTHNLIFLAYFDASDDNDSSFAGAALYPQIAASESFSLGLRAEYFVETEGGAGAIGAYDADGDADIFAVTLTGSYTVGSLMIKPELRLDSASEEATFIDNDLKSSKSLSSFVVAAVYSF